MQKADLENADSEEKCLISKDEIYELLKKYSIGKKPLSRLLGWGETTVIRYTEGDVPTQEYSDRLFYLLNNPVFYYEVLINNRDKITKVAFEKSRRAVENCIYHCKLMKIGQAVLNEAGSELGCGALQFICYYVQVCHLYFYNEPAFEDEFNTEVNFCPYPCLQNMQEWYYRVAHRVPEELKLTQTETQLIREVVFAFRWYGMETMKGIMSLERNHLKISKNAKGEMVISHDTLKKHFDNVFSSLQIQSPKDFGKYIYPKAMVVIHE